MQRRQLLGTLGGLGTAAIAGCTGGVSSRTLSSPSIETEDGEVHLVFGEDDSRLAVSTVQYRSLANERSRFASVRYFMSHREDTHVDSLELSVRAPPSGHQPPADLYLAVPDRSKFPEITVESHPATQARLVTIPELGDLGRGTFGLAFFLDARNADTAVLPTRIDVRSEVTGSGFLGPDYTLEGGTEIDIPLG